MNTEQITRIKASITRFLGTKCLNEPYPYIVGKPEQPEQYAVWRVGEGRLEAWFDCERTINLTLCLPSHRVHMSLQATCWKRRLWDGSDHTLLYIEDEDCTVGNWRVLLSAFLSLVKANRATLARPMIELVDMRQCRPRTRDASPVRRVKSAC
jgi:hypothetical protein